MADLDSKTWLSYTEAAKLVGCTDRNIRRWRQEGMPMGWRVVDGQRERVVEKTVLQAWWHERMKASPVHYYRMRKRAAEEGWSAPPLPASLNRTNRTVSPEPSGVLGCTSDRPVGPPAPTRAPEPLVNVKPMRGGDEFDVLHETLKRVRPACDGYRVFVSDGKLDERREAEMESICLGCPVFVQCRAFAEVARPAGFWAGQRWS
ncbi:hypothetical protein [Microbacterium sp.]|uniref:hypothetical protein n=1 Tax=Microbacterium sp. TaxID=51671 RepID=UPI0039E5B5BC